MATLATLIVPIIQSVQPAASTAYVRGTRVTIQSDGTVATQDASLRGDFVMLQDVGSVASPTRAQAAPLASGGSVGMLSLVTAAVGDGAYAAAAGKVTNVSTNAILVGTYRQACLTANTLAAVELKSVA